MTKPRFTGWTGVTRREGEAMWFINWHIGTYGTGPSMGEIAAHIGCCRTDAHRVSQRLRAKKMINILPGQARAIALTRPVDADLTAA
jgi:SOS-response transcriptional repressor LexA